jgi:hypothetical protein
MRKSDTIKSFRKKKSQELVRVVNYLNSVKMQMNFEASKLAAASSRVVDYIVVAPFTRFSNKPKKKSVKSLPTPTHFSS